MPGPKIIVQYINKIIFRRKYYLGEVSHLFNEAAVRVEKVQNRR